MVFEKICAEKKGKKKGNDWVNFQIWCFLFFPAGTSQNEISIETYSSTGLWEVFTKLSLRLLHGQYMYGCCLTPHLNDKYLSKWLRPVHCHADGMDRPCSKVSVVSVVAVVAVVAVVSTVSSATASKQAYCTVLIIS